jgi:hypothetical protein
MPFAARSIHVAATSASLVKHELHKCTGCTHCKNMRIKWAEYSGRPFYNYILYFTVVPIGVDGNYRFMCIRVGA